MNHLDPEPPCTSQVASYVFAAALPSTGMIRLSQPALVLPVPRGIDSDARRAIELRTQRAIGTIAKREVVGPG